MFYRVEQIKTQRKDTTMNNIRLSLRLITICLGLTILSGCIAVMPTPDYIDPVSNMQFVHVPAGTFQMGPSDGGKKRELPVHTVTLEAFSVGMHEVTFSQFDQFCEATSRKRPDDRDQGRDNRPVINVTWEDAVDYAEWLSKETGLDFSLPSESEWEYMARAGTTTPYWSGTSLSKGSANCRECGSEWDNKSTAPIGSFRPNPWGIYDTAGNVSEWAMDSYHEGYTGAPTDGRARLDMSNSDKVTRGGSWRGSKNGLKASTRDWANKGTNYIEIGFRLVIKGLAPVAPEKKK